MTILDYAGVEHPRSEFKGRALARPSGVSMRGFLEGKSDVVRTEDQWVAFELFGNRFLVAGDYKVMRVRPAMYSDGKWPMYNIKTDPGETTPLEEKEPERFINELGLQDVHIVGPDVGMGAALHYVIHHEHKALSLLIGDGPGVAPSHNGSVINKMVDSAFWRFVFRIVGATAFVEGGNRLCYTRYAPSYAEIADYVASYQGRIHIITKWFSGYPESLDSVDPHLENLDLPIQVFWGEHDVLLFEDNGRRLHERLKRSQLKVLEGCGHSSFQDKADEFASMILDWVNGGYRKL